MHIHKNYGKMYTLYSITLDTLVVEGRCARGHTRPAKRQLMNYFSFRLLLRVPLMRLFSFMFAFNMLMAICIYIRI
jgi:hypothetical protein